MPSEQRVNDLTKEIMKDIRIIEERINHLDREVVKMRTQIIFFILFLEIVLSPLLGVFFSFLVTLLRAQ